MCICIISACSSKSGPSQYGKGRYEAFDSSRAQFEESKGSVTLREASSESISYDLSVTSMDLALIETEAGACVVGVIAGVAAVEKFAVFGFAIDSTSLGTLETLPLRVIYTPTSYPVGYVRFGRHHLDQQSSSADSHTLHALLFDRSDAGFTGQKILSIDVSRGNDDRNDTGACNFDPTTHRIHPLGDPDSNVPLTFGADRHPSLWSFPTGDWLTLIHAPEQGRWVYYVSPEKTFPQFPSEQDLFYEITPGSGAYEEVRAFVMEDSPLRGYKLSQRTPCTPTSSFASPLPLIQMTDFSRGYTTRTLQNFLGNQQGEFTSLLTLCEYWKDLEYAQAEEGLTYRLLDTHGGPPLIELQHKNTSASKNTPSYRLYDAETFSAYTLSEKVAQELAQSSDESRPIWVYRNSQGQRYLIAIQTSTALSVYLFFASDLSTPIAKWSYPLTENAKIALSSLGSSLFALIDMNQIVQIDLTREDPDALSSRDMKISY